MRRLTTLALVLIVLAVLGYFSWLNRQTVSVSVYGTFTVQLQLWMVMAVFFVAGVLLAESRNLTKYPTRFVRMLQQGWQGWRLHRRLSALEAFEEACLRCALDDARRALGRISGPPLSLHVRLLELKRFRITREQLLEEFDQMRQAHPERLEVLLPNLRWALEASRWLLAESLCNEINRLAPGHPHVREGLRSIALDRQEWRIVVEQERALLQDYSGSTIAEAVAEDHEAHLIRALQENPEDLRDWRLNYLPRRDRVLQEVPSLLGEVSRLRAVGQLFRAMALLQRGYNRTAAPELLDALESLYHEPGVSEKVLELVGSMRQEHHSLPLTLTHAKLLYLSGRHEDADSALAVVTVPESQRPKLYHTLRYLIAMRQGRSDEALLAAGHLVSEASLTRASQALN